VGLSDETTKREKKEEKGMGKLQRSWPMWDEQHQHFFYGSQGFSFQQIQLILRSQ